MSRSFMVHYRSPIGFLEIRGSERGVSGVNFVDSRGRRAAQGAARSLPVPLADCLTQIDEYFRGDRRTFAVKLDLRGTNFQKRVWRELLSVPFGKTMTYKALAKAIGNPEATRAVGGANHSNPVSIIIPCHRVIGSDGCLTGYGGGLWRKEWLLRHEGHGLLLI